MKKINFGDLDFSIVNSCLYMRSLLKGKDRVRLFNEFTARPMLYYGQSVLCMQVYFEIEDNSDGAFDRIEEILTERYDAGEQTASGSLRSVKNKRNEAYCYIEHTTVPRRLNGPYHLVGISFKMPYPFTCPYRRLRLFAKVIDRVKEERGLNYLISPDPAVGGYSNSDICQYLTSDGFEYTLIIKPRKYIFTSNKLKMSDGNTKVREPHWSQRGKYRDLEDLYLKLDAFFCYLEDYDEGLIKRS